MTETAWSRNVDWKARYSKLYSSRGLSQSKKEEPSRISFMINDVTPYASLLSKIRTNRYDGSNPQDYPIHLTSLMSQRSECYGSSLNTILRVPGPLRCIERSANNDWDWRPTCRFKGFSMRIHAHLHCPHSSLCLTKFEKNPPLPPLKYVRNDASSRKARSFKKCDDLGGHETLLLDMVRSRSCEARDEVHDQPSPLPREDNTEHSQNASESCVHGLSYRVTERSISRSRVSRMSMKRDMDIPSILAFTASPTPSPVCLEIPGFQKVKPQGPDIPRWSIRRSVCPVCSQKWRDKSSIRNIKYSGLKRNLSNELPSVIAPARIRTAIAMEYVPRSIPAAIDKEAGLTHGGLRNGSASWLLSRARRFRAPKLQMPPPEATAPPSCSAPLARKDLNARVLLFLSDQIRLK